MGNIAPPPAPAVPTVQDSQDHSKTMDFTAIWRKWFVDLAAIINKSGGVTGSVPPSRLVSTTAPLTGGGDLSEDRTITFGSQLPNTVLAGPSVGPTSAAPTFRSLVYSDMTGISASIILAKITPLGNDGTLTFQNGLLTNFIAPT